MRRLQLISLLTCVIILMLPIVAMGKTYVKVTHEVKTGEDLTCIAMQYITPDRYLPEFREGIVEHNWNTVFYDRGRPAYVVPGDILEVCYWKD